MSHTLICGLTESGKTTLAQSIAQKLAAKKQNIIVYDPVGTPTAANGWPQSAIRFNNEMDFLRHISKEETGHVHIFVDEAGDLFNLKKEYNFWMLTKGRHMGFQMYVITQRPKLVAPSVRSQCSVAYVFRLRADDMKEVGADYATDFKDQKPLDTGDFFVLRSNTTEIKRANVFTLINKPHIRRK